jgi:hypothetical protein
LDGPILDWVSVFLAGLCVGLSVAILVVLWRVWATTDRAEQDGKERLAMLREQQERLHHLHEERRVLLDELERLREQKERLQWLRDGRAALLAELKKLRSQVEEQRQSVETPLPAHTEPRLRLVAVGDQPPTGNGQGSQQALVVDSGSAGALDKFDGSKSTHTPPNSRESETAASRNRLLRFLAPFVAMWRHYR